MFDWYDISQKFVLLHMFQGWFPSISAWLFLTWSLSCSLDPLPRVSEFLERLFVHCPTTQVHMQTHPFTDELRSPVRKQDQRNGTTQGRAGFSSAGMNRVTESAWAECWYNYQTAAGNSCCHTSSHSRAGAPVGRVGWDSRVCRWCLQRAAPCARSAALNTSATCPARLAWVTPGLTHSWPLPEGKCVGNTKILWSPTLETEGSAHCLVHVGVSTARRGWTAGYSWVPFSELMPAPKYCSFKCNHNWHAQGHGLTAVFLDLVP